MYIFFKLILFIIYKQLNINLDRSIYSQYNDFNYNDKDIFKIDVDFMLDVYNIQLMKSSKIRSNQDTFRNKLIIRDISCVITGNDYDECDAAHIIPLLDSNNYDIDNGLLLTGSLHDTFDKHYWCIDPIYLTVVLNKSKIGNKNLTCCEYENKKIRITPNNKLLHNLQKRYEIFMDSGL